MKKSSFVLSILMFIAVGSLNLYAQGKWMLTANFQMNSGKYIFDQNLNTYYLFGGISYDDINWSFSASLPVIASDDGSVGSIGNMISPTQGSMHNNSNPTYTNTSHHGMMGSGSTSSFSNLNFSLGDLYLNGNYKITNQYNSGIDFYVKGFVKIPFVDKSKGLGTGKFDYSFGLGLRKYFDPLFAYAEAGYLVIGDTEELNYNNPITYGIGIGDYLLNNKLGILLSVEGYSKLIDSYQPPIQASLGLIYSSNNTISYTVTFSKGFTNLNSNYIMGFGMGFRF